MGTCLRLIIFIHALVLLLTPALVITQDHAKLSGKVTDDSTETGIEADVKLIPPDGKIIGVRCDSLGSFIILNLKFGTYRLEISAMDYSTLIIEKLEIKSAQLKLDTLHLKKQNISTEEILVEDEKGMLTLEGDKKIFNPDKSMLTKGTNALDVLRKTPLVDVDVNDNVSLRGSTNVLILIDDRPNKFVNLKTLPSDAIERIELLTNPPAKYSAEGVTGIINIVLKKKIGLGYNGSIYLSAGSKDRYYGGGNFSFKKDKTTLFTGIYLGLYNFSSSYTTLTEYYQPHSFLDGSGSSGGDNKYGYGSVGMEYDLTPKSILSIDGFMNGGPVKNSGSFRYNSLDASSNLSSYYIADNSYEGTWQNYSSSLYYNNKFNDKGRELSADLTYSGNKYTSPNKSNLTFFDESGNQLGAPNIKIDNTTTITRTINAQADYTHPFTDKTRLEIGIKGLFRINDNDFSSDTLNNSIGIWQTNEATRNRFRLPEYINAAYATFSSTIGKFTYKLGLRAELTHTIGELVNSGTNFTKIYYNLFPTVNLSYSIGAANQVQLSYSRRITRPGIWRLNPFVYRYSARFVYYGNPQLNPEFTNSFELSFIYYSKLITLTPLAFYRRSVDIISNYSYLQDTNINVTTYRNAAGSHAYGLDLILNSRTLSWLNLNGTLSFYNTKFDTEAITDYQKEEGFSWKANIRSYITIAGFNLELYYNYTGRRINAQGSNEPTSSLDLGLGRAFFDSKARVNLRVSDVFRNMNWTSKTDASGYSTENKYKYDTRAFYLTISYTFGNTDENYQQKKKTKQNENEGQDQQENNQK